MPHAEIGALSQPRTQVRGRWVHLVTAASSGKVRPSPRTCVRGYDGVDRCGAPARCATPRTRHAACAPQHFLYFLPLPQGQGSFRPTFGASRVIVLTLAPSPCACDDASCISPPPVSRRVSLTP